MDEIIEQLKLVHRVAAERARQTGLDTDWNDAQSIEHEIDKATAISKEMRGLGRKLGAYEMMLRTLHELYPFSPPFNFLRQNYPDLYKEIVDGSTINSEKDT